MNNSISHWVGKPNFLHLIEFQSDDIEDIEEEEQKIIKPLWSPFPSIINQWLIFNTFNPIKINETQPGDSLVWKNDAER